ncbi:unnamed protein product, partial [Vitis vinifera]
MEFLSTPHAWMHCSVSIHADIPSTTTSDVLHCNSVVPSVDAHFSSRHRFPEEAMEKEHRSVGSPSHISSPVPRAPCRRREKAKKRMNAMGF